MDIAIAAGIDKAKDIGPSAFMLYVYICTIANGNGECSPSYDDMQTLGLSRQTISGSLKILIAAGLIEREKQHHKPAVYRVKVSKYESLKNRLPTTTLKDSFNLINVNSSSSESKSPQIRLSRSQSLENRLSPGYIDELEAEMIFQEVTGWATFPASSRGDDINAICALWTKHGEKTVEYLRSYFKAAREKYPHTTRTFWLTDWAIGGHIPDKTNGKAGVTKIDPVTGKVIG